MKRKAEKKKETKLVTERKEAKKKKEIKNSSWNSKKNKMK